MEGQFRAVPDIRVTLLGRFAVTVGGVPVAEAGWTRRHAAAVVKVLALAPGQRLHREQVIDLIWPDDTLAAAVPKLHKAAHYAGMVPEIATMVVLCSLWRLMPQRYGPVLPRTFPARGTGGRSAS